MIKLQCSSCPCNYSGPCVGEPRLNLTSKCLRHTHQYERLYSSLLYMLPWGPSPLLVLWKMRCSLGAHWRVQSAWPVFSSWAHGFVAELLSSSQLHCMEQTFTQTKWIVSFLWKKHWLMNPLPPSSPKCEKRHHVNINYELYEEIYNSKGQKYQVETDISMS